MTDALFHFTMFNLLVAGGGLLVDWEIDGLTREIWTTVIAAGVPTANLCYWTGIHGPEVGFFAFGVIAVVYGLVFYRWL